MSNLRFRPAADIEPDPASATLTQRVHDALREEILSGTLPPGTRLVRRAIAKRLGVSPIPVTEALLRLEVEGLVQSRPLCGCRVCPLELDDVQNEAILREDDRQALEYLLNQGLFEPESLPKAASRRVP